MVCRAGRGAGSIGSMKGHTPPPNWVSERAKCTVDLAFRALAEIIDRDVEEANSLSDDIRKGYTFAIEHNGEGLQYRIQVRRNPPPNAFGFETKSVTFEKSERQIRIKGDWDSFVVLPKWDTETATCKLQIDGSTLKPWEISRRALERLFFDLSPT